MSDAPLLRWDGKKRLNITRRVTLQRTLVLETSFGSNCANYKFAYVILLPGFRFVQDYAEQDPKTHQVDTVPASSLWLAGHYHDALVSV